VSTSPRPDPDAGPSPDVRPAVPLDALLEALPDAHLLAGTDGHVVAANGGALRLLGASSLTGTRLHDLVADPAERVDDLLRRFASSDQHRPGALELRTDHGPVAVRLDGARVHGTALVVMRVREHPDAVEPFAAVAGEVERRNLREMRDRLQRSLEDLQDANRRLQSSNDELDRYATIVSHDLRTPLATIAGFADLLYEDHRDDLDPDGREAVAVIQRAVGRMAEVTRAMLDLARLNEEPHVDTPVDPAEAAEEATEQLVSDIREHRAEVRVGAIPPVLVDRTHLVQILQNLISNAVRFCHPGRPPRIEIAGARRDEMVELTVRDNGVGVADADKESVFDLLWQGSSADGVGGSGIGLATCRKIVELYGGRIRCEDPPDGPGTVFAVTLPAGA
jgi:signal transduction histidine kinase